MAYENEAEQIEAIKKWWQENGVSVLTGIVLGFALLFGWRTYQNYTEQQASQASVMYEQILYALDQGEQTQAREMASKLLSEHNNSEYAILTALNLARQDLEANDLEAAHARLQWVIDQNQSASFNHLARLRKARLYLAQNKVDAAQQILNVENTGQFAGAYAELRGDIAVASKNEEAARSAYETALSSDDLSQTHRQLVQMKLDDVGGKKSDVAQVIVASPPTEFAPEKETVVEKDTVESETTQSAVTTEDTSVIEEVATETTLSTLTHPIVSESAASPVLEPEEKKTNINIEKTAVDAEESVVEEAPAIESEAIEEAVVIPEENATIDNPMTLTPVLEPEVQIVEQVEETAVNVEKPMIEEASAIESDKAVIEEAVVVSEESDATLPVIDNPIVSAPATTPVLEPALSTPTTTQ